ncbi:MAG: hypothetical protein KDD47_09085 [Acidobacteria bacterium]|nr:hypothetical protein [Acidobacteriota bacterium]
MAIAEQPYQAENLGASRSLAAQIPTRKVQSTPDGKDEQVSGMCEPGTAAQEKFSREIVGLDFTMVKRKLQDAEEGQGWTTRTCDEVEAEYKRFLFLKQQYPAREIVPNRMVDVFWHQHILDTEKYARDCSKVFGFFLHHYPYFGMLGEDDRRNLDTAFAETERLYREHFGEDYGFATGRCRTQCKPVKCK